MDGCFINIDSPTYVGVGPCFRGINSEMFRSEGAASSMQPILKWCRKRQMVVSFLFLFVCMCVCEGWGGRETEKGKEGELDRKGRMVMMEQM